MKYRDKHTIHLGRKNQSSTENYDPHTARRNNEEKRLLKKLEVKITDKIWWSSLEKDDKLRIVREYYWCSEEYKKIDGHFIIFENKMKIAHPGDIIKQRDIKLNKIIK